MLTLADLERIYKKQFGSEPEFGLGDPTDQIELILEALKSNKPIPDQELPTNQREARF